MVKDDVIYIAGKVMGILGGINIKDWSLMLTDDVCIRKCRKRDGIWRKT